MSCANIVCSADAYRKYVVKRPNNMPSLADNLYLNCIEKYIEIYGVHSISSNVHNLCHVTDDVRRCGSLGSISTYPFENRLRDIKLNIKTCNKPLEQISRRIGEIELTNKAPHTLRLKELQNAMYPKLKHRISGTNTAYEKIIFNPNFCLSGRKSSDNWFLNKDRAVMEMTKIVDSPLGLHIYGKVIRNKSPFFKTPFDSTQLDIYISDGELNDETFCNSNEIICKLICFHYGRYSVFMPLLHTIRI